MIDKDTIEKLRQKLAEEKEKIEKELSTFAKPTEKEGEFETKFEDLGDEPDENATEVNQYVDNLSVEHSLEARLKEINEALEEIKEGTYGICKNCEQEIDIERLRAYPAARTCIKCN